MALDSYMVIFGEGKTGEKGKQTTVVKSIEGEFQDEDQRGAFEVFNFEWSVRAETTEETAKSNKKKKNKTKSKGVGDIEVRKVLDNASTELLAACCGGCSFESAKIVFRKSSGGKPIHYLVVYLGEVRIVEWDLDIEDTTPMEKLRIGFDTCYVKYIPQTHEGGKTPSPIITGFYLPDKEVASTSKIVNGKYVK